jgi:hypothetical protein
MDWIHWGMGSATKIDRKNYDFLQITNFLKLGPVSADWFADNLVSYNWSDGKPPTVSTTGTTTGVFINNAVGNGFEITAPADTNLKTLKVYVGVWFAQGRFEASLSDGSAPTYVDTSIGVTPGRSNGVYTVQYKSATEGQTLRIRYTIQTNHFSPFGNVTLESATLQ